MRKYVQNGVHRWMAACFAGGLLVASPASAKDFPAGKPVTIIVPFAPGGGTDILSRMVSEELAKNLSVPVLVENRPGGNTLIAAQSVARAAPDGHTILTAISSTMTMNPHLYSKLPYEPKKDFAPVTLASSMPLVLAVNPEFPAKSLRELTALLAQNPGKYSYAYGAIPAQVLGELYRQKTGVEIQGISYNGSSPAQNDVMGGHVPIIVDALTPALSLLKSDRLRPIAVSSAKRSAALPDTPSLSEAGLEGVDIADWTGFFVPAGTPQSTIDKLHAAFSAALNTPKIRNQLESLGQTVYAADGKTLAEWIDRDYAVYGEVIRDAGIKID
ncbi:MAG: tripartite tricarboxylate transporter substrate binding protein [Pigmentiphaga sp.]|nr:tripartite tricarboxylate transporter substrate binding protein [Pigmentiphaga sp.]